MHPDATVNPWTIGTAACRSGGQLIVPRNAAPLGRCLPYRRAAGEQPPFTGGAELTRRLGWYVTLGDRGLGDVLLALGLAQALIDGTGHDEELHYRGTRPRLMQRCRLPLRTRYRQGPDTVYSGTSGALGFHAVPEKPQTWLDVLDDDRVEVHASLPMRYYLTAEQSLGVRLPADRAPVPTFLSHEPERPCHVVFVGATSRPDRKDYGPDGFARIARTLADRFPAPWTFTMLTGMGTAPVDFPEADVLLGPDAVDCVDVFASANLVIGNDTGLTHLAALTERLDGTGPQVVGLYGRHAHTKWTTGSPRHHAVATPFSQMLSVADRCPVRDRLDDALWAHDLATLPAELIADFAADLIGRWT